MKISLNRLSTIERDYKRYLKAYPEDHFEENWVGFIANIAVQGDWPSGIKNKEFEVYNPSKNTVISTDKPIYMRSHKNPQDWVEASREWAEKNMALPAGRSNESEG